MIAIQSRQKKGNIVKNQGRTLLEELGVWSLGNKLGFMNDDVCMNMPKLGLQLVKCKKTQHGRKKQNIYL